MSPQVTIDYPRRRLPRHLLRAGGRVLLPLLTQTTVKGRHNFPKHGPLLVVGNHMATMEVVLMIINAPWPMEMLGASDLNPPPWMQAITQFHGFIPVNRGNFDRHAMTQALDVLCQGGILGIFPEGGVWDPGAMDAKRGVAWLSYHSNTPILPIGFGGVEGAMDKLFKLQRPLLSMHVGEIMPPVTVTAETSRRQALQQAANQIMDAVEALIPEAFRLQHPEIVEEHFTLRLTVWDQQGNEIQVPAEYAIVHADALCKFFYRPWMLHIFVKDLHFPAQALQRLEEDPSPESLLTGLDHIANYVKHENPGFFPYRFGPSWGIAMEHGLQELRNVTKWAADNTYTLQIRPTRRYRIADQREEIVETRPPLEHVW